MHNVPTCKMYLNEMTNEKITCYKSVIKYIKLSKINVHILSMHNVRTWKANCGVANRSDRKGQRGINIHQILQMRVPR